MIHSTSAWRRSPLLRFAKKEEAEEARRRRRSPSTPFWSPLVKGCALPMWMSSGLNDRPLAPFAGILSLGIGDTMASMVGHKYGVLRWSKSGRKTIEGTAAGITFVLVACFVLLPLLASTGYIATQNWSSLLFCSILDWFIGGLHSTARQCIHTTRLLLPPMLITVK